jgi:flagellar biosynthesis protein FliQ
MTLSFVPKLFTVLAALALLAPYILNSLTEYFRFIFEEIAMKGL